MNPNITVSEIADASVHETLLNGILRFSERQAGPACFRPLLVLLSDPDGGTIIGGLWGRTSWSFLFVELLHVPEALRGQGIGSRLLLQAEEEALRRGCYGAWLDTFSFQALEFYRQRGYTVFGTIEDYPRGHTRYFLRKALASVG